MPAPSVAASLIVTLLNEEDSIEVLLHSIGAQTVVPAEVVFVDGGSTDRTVEFIRAWQPPPGVSVEIRIENGAGISRGRNRGIEAARHDLLFVTDAGTRLDAQWSARMWEAFEAPNPPDVVSGFFRPTGSTFLERAIAFVATPRLAEISPEAFLPSSRSVGFTREAWSTAGGYPEWLDYGEDLVFDLALRDTGRTFAFTPDAWVTWSARPHLPGFMTQYFRYARGDGKAGLWPRRHAARYAAYGAGTALLVLLPRNRSLAAPLALAGAWYLRTTWMRVLMRRAEFGPGWMRALALAPVIVAAGDVAKMVGYPVGVIWRLRRAGRADGR